MVAKTKKSNEEVRMITAALPFVNNLPHLGNIVGSHLPADIFARFCRLKGYKTIFVGGTDEHGTATEFTAQAQNKTPKQLCDELYQKHKEVYDWFGISYDNFSRTSRDIHHELVKKFFLCLYKKGYITEKKIKIPFCENCKKGLADRYITGTCPVCGYEEAKGDQCEKCATLIDPIELKNPFCSVCKSKNIIFKDTNHLFLDLRNLSGKIEDWIDKNKNLRSQVKNLAKGWLKQGIQERCITRDLKWGIKIPIKGYEDKVFYVWFENVIGYVSATLEILGEEGEKIWKDKNTKTYYFVGKDNIPFHTIFWPGQLIGSEMYILPYNVIGLQYLNFEKQKFSKSKGIGIFSDQVMNSGIPLDYWRFYLTCIIPETKDSDFMIDEFKERINSELIGNFGNLTNRTLNLIQSKHKGELPKIKSKDKEFEDEVKKRISLIEKSYEACEFRAVLSEILRLSDLGNQYINEKEPWKTGDTDVLNYGYELIRIISVLFSPIIPSSSEEILKMLKSSNKSLEINTSEKSINPPKIIFKKLEDEDLKRFKKT